MMKHSMWIIGLLLVLACPVHAEVVITEVLYDIAGADNSLEWVELLNTGPGPVNLSGYKLGWGGADYSYGEFELGDITLEACAVHVVGGPISNESNGNPFFDSPRLFDPNIQNSGITADGVALFHPSDPSCPVDVVIYGSSNDNNLIDETCMTGPIDVGDAPSGSSIERTFLDGIWNIQENPSPNQTPFICESASGVDSPRVPGLFQLDQNWPNPFNPQTTIYFDLPSEIAVTLHIYDIAGRLVDVLLDDQVAQEGRNEAIWRGRDMDGLVAPAGIYFYRLEAGEYSETKRMALIK